MLYICMCIYSKYYIDTTQRTLSQRQFINFIIIEEYQNHWPNDSIRNVDFSLHYVGTTFSFIVFPVLLSITIFKLIL